ncbi:hypothetical protein BT96DRAFT_1004921 [Gymnopus androsaceus JB14]|uniref:DUF6532 domain-containing protein n=1 Tax=Gymnopus androsaceus JB14 TaxID=1447944 RepID=A0A6A4GQZ6_9AGAR|nr:hypothetical protein BT96DRAFT_1004921 [Gymnopus androsaceus JB14]
MTTRSQAPATRSSNASTRKQTRSQAATGGKSVTTKPKAKTTRAKAPPPSSSPVSSPSTLSASEVKTLQALHKKKKEAQRQAEATRVQEIQQRARALAQSEAEADVEDSDMENQDEEQLQYPESDSEGVPHQRDGNNDDDNEDRHSLCLSVAVHAGDDAENDEESDADNSEDVNHAADMDTGSCDVNNMMDVDNPSNNIEVDSSPAPSTPSKKAPQLWRPFSSPSRAHNAVVAGHVTPLCCCRSGKVTEAQFTPRTLNLANKGKRAAHRATVVEDAFAVDKHAHNMSIIQKLAIEDMDGPLYEAILVCWLTWRSRRMSLHFFPMLVVGSLQASSHVPVRTMTAPEVKELVRWLTEDGHHKYGGINTELRAYNTKRPFGCEGLAHILHLEVFATKGGANIDIFRDIVSAGRIGGPTIALLLTVIEHALNEYSEGVHRHAEFSDAARSRYLYHLSSYNKIACRAPTWANNFEINLYKLIITQSNKAFLLDVQADDLTEVDVAGLEADAVAEKSQVGPIPTPAAPTSTPAPSASVAATVNTPAPAATANAPAPVFPLPGSHAAAAAASRELA